MTYKASFFTVVLSAVLGLSQIGLAQEQLSSSVFGNGGGVSSNSSFRIAGTVGQPIIGTASNNDNIQQAGFWYTTFDIITSVEQIDDDLLPTEFRLDQNYPNPFNPSTTIRFAIPRQEHVTLIVYDLMGRKVATLVDEQLAAGEYSAVFDAGGIASGMYVYRIHAGSHMTTRRMVLLK